MNLRNGSAAQFGLLLALTAAFVTLASCSGGGGSTFSQLNSGNNNPPPPSANNSLSVQVNFGPANNLVNGLFASVTVCVPGSSNCQTIDNVLVDTGSEGLRILESQLKVTLPPVTISGGSALQECLSFADMTYVWGPVATADIELAGQNGEKATSVPIQIISASPAFPAPAACTRGGGPDENTVDALGATGILGVGNFRQDCGSACTNASTNPGLYFLCSGSTCETVPVSLANQLQNPVWLFPRDNNGVLVSLPSVPDTGAQTVSGTLVFGVGTQSNNVLGAAQVYTTDADGNFQTAYNGIAYRMSYIDSGSNAIYFLDASTLGIPECKGDNVGFYCPDSTVNYTATNTGLNGTSGQVSFSIANADALFRVNNGLNAAFINLGGDNSGSFDWGLPFFFGRNVFVGIEGQAATNGVLGPYWAY